MTITVVGPGALGCLFAALLSKAGHSVWLLDHNPERSAQLSRRGVCLIEALAETYPIKSTVNAKEIGGTDVILLCVKSYDVPDALRQTAPLLEDGPLLIAMQNGLGHHKALRQVKNWAVGITAQGAVLLDPGVVKHGGSGLTTLGFMEDVGAEALDGLAEVAGLFEGAELPTCISSDIEAAIWNKLLINVGINALTVIYDCPNGELLENPKAREQMRQAVTEAAMIASAKGIKITPDPVAKAEMVCRATSKNISSMLQDIRHGRITEIGSINGVIVREAESMGLIVPVNRLLTAQVTALQAVD